LKDCERLILKYEDFADGKIHVWIAPGSIWYSTLETFQKAKEIAEKYKVWLSTHCAESTSVKRFSRQKYGMSEIELLEKIGFLGPNTQLVHCVWLSNRDIKIMKRRAVKVAHCPIANMYLADGVAPIPQLMDARVTVGLGTDGAASNNNQDMIAVVKSATLLHKVNTLNPMAINSLKSLEMATVEGAKSIGLEKEIGSIERGKKADLILVNFKKPNTVVTYNPVSAFVYSATPENIETVIVDGRIIMEKRIIKTVDEGTVLKMAEKAGKHLVLRRNNSVK
jgi:5-methylthioadenosine/S-adenosylhomocysteine deaminase